MDTVGWANGRTIHDVEDLTRIELADAKLLNKRKPKNIEKPAEANFKP